MKNIYTTQNLFIQSAPVLELSTPFLHTPSSTPLEAHRTTAGCMYATQKGAGRGNYFTPHGIAPTRGVALLRSLLLLSAKYLRRQQPRQQVPHLGIYKHTHPQRQVTRILSKFSPSALSMFSVR